MFIAEFYDNKMFDLLHQKFEGYGLQGPEIVGVLEREVIYFSEGYDGCGYGMSLDSNDRLRTIRIDPDTMSSHKFFLERVADSGRPAVVSVDRIYIPKEMAAKLPISALLWDFEKPVYWPSQDRPMSWFQRTFNIFQLIGWDQYLKEEVEYLLGNR